MASIRTAMEEHYGTSIDVAIGSNFRLRLPYGPGGCRTYVLRPSSAGLGAVLPIASFMKARGQATYRIVNLGAHSLELRDTLGTVVATIPVNNSARVYLHDNTTPQGTWLTRVKSGSIASSVLAGNRLPLTLVIGSGAFGVNLRTLAGTGLDVSQPYAVTVDILNTAVIGGLPQGSNPNRTTALHTGTSWPAGTTFVILIANGGGVLGAGGAGGVGASVSGGLSAQPGKPGGIGITTYYDMAIVNHGVLQGGGGGGGGGVLSIPPHTANGPGGSGGGGAGHQPGAGGPASFNAQGQPYAPSVGSPGGAYTPGAPGSGVAMGGGSGGFPGEAGLAASALPPGGVLTFGAAGGAAGPSVAKLTGRTVIYLGPNAPIGPEESF